jgi:hypothetical protein
MEPDSEQSSLISAKSVTSARVSATQRVHAAGRRRWLKGVSGLSRFTVLTADGIDQVDLVGSGLNEDSLREFIACKRWYFIGC